MRDDDGQEPWPGRARLTAWIALGLIGCFRAFDGFQRGGPWRQTLVVSAVVVPVALLLLPRPRRIALVPVVALYCLPFALFGLDWAWVPWPIALVTLRLLPSRWGWPAFGLVLAATLVGGWLAGDPLVAVVHRAKATAIDALILFGVATLADLVGELHRTRREPARQALRRQRRDLHEHLTSTVGGSLAAIAEYLDRARIAEEGAAAQQVRAAVDAARRTLANVRAASGRYRAVRPALDGPDLPVPAVARLSLLGVFVLQAAETLLFLSRPDASFPTARPLWAVLAGPLLAGSAVLLWARPARARLIVLALLMIPPVFPGALVDPTWGYLVNVWGFLVGATLIQLRPPCSWLVAGALIGAHIALFFYPPPVPAWPAMTMAIASDVILAWLTYGLSRLADLVGVIAQARADLAREAILADSARTARDLHDVIGSTLTAVALKGELWPRTDLADLTALVHRSRIDLARLASDGIQLHLVEELDAARDLLRSAGVTARVRADGGPWQPALARHLAAAVREATTNVVRHSTARSCTVAITHQDHVVRLTVRNDGVRSTHLRPGSGLIGLSERAGGRLTYRLQPGGWFELVAEFRSDPPRLAGDPDRVDPVAPTDLVDGGGQVVADRAVRQE